MTDIMDVRAKQAFSQLLRKGYLKTIEPGTDEGSRLYWSVKSTDIRVLSRDEKMVLFHARWPDTSDAILHKVSDRLRLSNQVRWNPDRFVQSAPYVRVAAGCRI